METTKEFTQRFDFSEERIKKVCNSIQDYGEKAINSTLVKKAWRAKMAHYNRTVNTPEGYPAIYFYIKLDGEDYYDWFTYGILEDYEGRAFCRTSTTGDLTVFHGHAIRRYFERHGFDGTYEECEKYVLSSLYFICGTADQITGEFLIYFDDGVFIGERNGKYYRVKTWIKNTQCYQQQRLISKNTENALKELVRANKYDPKSYGGAVMNSIEYLKNLA